MQLIGLNDYMGRTMTNYGDSSPRLRGLPDTTPTQCLEQPCFTIDVDSKSYPMAIFKSGITFWALHGRFINPDLKTTNNIHIDELAYMLYELRKSGKKTYIDCEDGRIVHMFNPSYEEGKALNDFLENSTEAIDGNALRRRIEDFIGWTDRKTNPEITPATICSHFSTDFFAIAMGGVFTNKYGHKIIVTSGKTFDCPMGNTLASLGYFGKVTDKATNEDGAKGYNVTVGYKSGSDVLYFETGYSDSKLQMKRIAALYATNPERITNSNADLKITWRMLSDNYQNDDNYTWYRHMGKITRDEKTPTELFYDELRTLCDTLGASEKRIINIYIFRNEADTWANGFGTGLGVASILGIMGGVLGIGAILGTTLSNSLTGLAQSAIAGDPVSFKSLLKDPKVLTGVTGAILPSGSPLNSYVNSAVSMTTAYKNKDYSSMLSLFGMNGGAAQANNVIAGLSNNDIYKMASSIKNKNYSQLGAIAQNYRNSILSENLCDKITNSTALLNKVQGGDLNNFFSDPDVMNLFHVASGDGNTGVINTNFGTMGNLTSMMLQYDDFLNIHNLDATRQTGLIKTMLGLPVSSEMFDDVTLLSLEEQAVRNSELGKSYTSLAGTNDEIAITLPAIIPADKRDCFAKALACRGISVNFSPDGGTKTNGTNTGGTKTNGTNTGGTKQVSPIKKEKTDTNKYWLEWA